MSLHRKFTLFTALVMSAVIVVFSIINFEINKRQLRANQTDKVEHLAEIVRNGLMTIMLEGRGKEFQKFLDALVAEDIESIRIITENGSIINSTVPGEIGKKVSREYLSSYRSHEDMPAYLDSRAGGTVYSQIVLIKNDWICQRCHGNKENIRGFLDVEVSSAETEKRISDLRKTAVVSVLLVMALISVVVRLISRYLFERPVSAIIETVKKFEKGDYHSRADMQRNDELGALAESLNTILSDLEKSKAEIDRCLMDKDIHIAKMASLGELAATVAHDIKNPLAGISGALQVLAEDFPADSPRKEIAAEILNEIERLDASVKDLLVFARPPGLNVILTDINAVLEKIKYSLLPEATSLNVQINLISDNIPEVMIDPEQMEKALLNIAHSCISSMEGGGKLTVATKRKDDAGRVEIAISDTGRGIPEENLKDVFKPFFSTKHSGTGLGLAISRNIVENHGGTIEVESQRGSGTTFRIILGGKG